MIDDLYTESFTVQKNTEATGLDSIVTPTWSTDTTIGTAGVITGHIRILSERESAARGKMEVQSTHRVYTAVDSITEKHRLVHSDGRKFNVVSVDDPHELGEFMQIDVVRTDVERVDE